MHNYSVIHSIRLDVKFKASVDRSGNLFQVSELGSDRMWNPTQTCLSRATPTEACMTPKLCWHMAESYSYNYRIYYKEVITFNKQGFFQSWTFRFGEKEFYIENLVFCQRFLNTSHFPVPDSYHPMQLSFRYITVYLRALKRSHIQTDWPKEHRSALFSTLVAGPYNQSGRKGYNLHHTAWVNQGTKLISWSIQINW